MVKTCSNDDTMLYHQYIIELDQTFDYEIPVKNFVLCMRTKLDFEIANWHSELEFGSGCLTVNFKYGGEIHLNAEQVMFTTSLGL